jgi:UDP:flavonoid glycosyltransferase YjiC (YdhE family)
MAKIAAVTWDGGGNFPPLLHIADALTREGHDVKLLGHPAQRERVTAAGVDFVAYEKARPWSRTAAREDPLEPFKVFTDGAAGEDLDALLGGWPADLAIVDCLMLGPLQAAQARGVPTVALVHSFWAFFGELFPDSPVTELGAPHGRTPRELWSSATEVWVAADRKLDPVADEVPANARWIGVAQPPAEPAAARPRDRVLLSLSTLWFPGQQESMQNILDAVAGLPVECVATIDRGIAAAELRIPANVHATAFVDHGEVMPTVGAVIGHGGHATAMYALAHGLPLLVIPQFPIDQPLIGERLAALGAGIALEQTDVTVAIR